MDGTILGKKYDIIGGSGGGGHITPATTETLGGVIVGDGLSVTEEGVLSANSQTWNYSTEEVNTGQKWIDGKDIYAKVIVLTDPVNVNGNSWLENVDTISGESCVSVEALNTSRYCFPFGGGFNNGKFEIVNIRPTTVENVETIICRYTKTEA